MALRRLVANRVLANASISEVKIAPEELTSNVILDNSINAVKLNIASFSNYDVTLNNLTVNGVMYGNGYGLTDIQVANVTGLTTQNVPEHSDNLYFTETRARDSLSAGANITYNNVTGEIAVTDFTGDARGAIGAGPGITYNPATGVITVDQSAFVANIFALSSNDFISMLVYGQP